MAISQALSVARHRVLHWLFTAEPATFETAEILFDGDQLSMILASMAEARHGGDQLLGLEEAFGDLAA